MVKKSMWEILVPYYDIRGNLYSPDYHHKWDENVYKISDKLTILKVSKGLWASPDGKMFSEEMIPVRIYCSKKEIKSIVSMTLEHYDQKAVLAYELSDKVLFSHRQ